MAGFIRETLVEINWSALVETMKHTQLHKHQLVHKYFTRKKTKQKFSAFFFFLFFSFFNFFLHNYKLSNCQLRRVLRPLRRTIPHHLVRLKIPAIHSNFFSPSDWPMNEIAVNVIENQNKTTCNIFLSCCSQSSVTHILSEFSCFI